MLLLAMIVLSGCAALPRSGPLATDIATGGEEGLDGLVLPLDATVASLVNRPDTRGFPASFLARPEMDPSRIGIGDTLDVLIWETSGGGLFGSADSGAGTLADVRVDNAGQIFVPFAGKLRAAGSTPTDLSARIRTALTPLTLDPQVDVRLRDAPSRALTVQGAVARPGPYVLDRPALRLTPLLAYAGGASLPPEQAEVMVRRGSEAGRVMLDDLYRNPALDIAMAPGDLVVLNAIRERFLVLGASSVQAEIAFPTRRLDLLRALALARGLDDFNADPTGVFVFRSEDRAVADALLPGPQPPGLPAGQGRAIIYRLDMTRPESLFVAKNFDMRDGDAIFVTNAPLTELRKIIQLFTAALVPAQATTTFAP